jgi:hypothetical protein
LKETVFLGWGAANFDNIDDSDPFITLFQLKENVLLCASNGRQYCKIKSFGNGKQPKHSTTCHSTRMNANLSSNVLSDFVNAAGPHCLQNSNSRKIRSFPVISRLHPKLNLFIIQ